MLGATPREFESRILRHGHREARIAATAVSTLQHRLVVGPAGYGRRALAAGTTAVALAGVVGLLGPSATTVPLGAHGVLPPYDLGLDPPAWLVTLLLLAAVALAAGALLGGLAALRAGWSPSPRRLAAGGAAAALVLVLVPPTMSADVLSYTAYGREVVLGIDPYTVAPDAVDDGLVRRVEDPWRSTPSIYGPLATAEQAAVVALVGPSPRHAVGLLDALTALAFAGVGALLLAAAGPDPGRRRRAALLWSANPLLLLALVAGAHLDAVVLLGVAGALACLPRRPGVAGAVGAAGMLVKLSAVVPLLGIAWSLRRRPRWLVAFGVSAAAVTVAGYGPLGLPALRQARVAAGYVTASSPWRLVRSLLDVTVGRPLAHQVVAGLSGLAVVALFVCLGRSLPPEPAPDPGAGSRGHAASWALTGSAAWLLAATYVLPWYDALAWAPLALVPLAVAQRWERLLTVHTAVLLAAYLPARTLPLPLPLSLLSGLLRQVVAPLVVLGIVAVAVRRRSTRPGSSLSPQASLASLPPHL